MTDINKISEITGLSVRTLRKIDKAGFLKVTKSSDPVTDAARGNLRKGNRLTVLQQLHLARDKDARAALSPFEYGISATIEKLGDFEADAAPWTLSAKITLAARKDKDAITEIAVWIYGLLTRTYRTLSSGAVDHAFIGVRLLANVPDHHLAAISDQLRGAMWEARKHPALAGAWRVNENGVTEYFRPALDL